MKITGLIGEPASGKSTVMKNFIATLGEGRIVKDGLVVYHSVRRRRSDHRWQV